MEMKHRQKHVSLRCSNHGFTMVELLVAMVVSLLALAAIYSTFLAQHRSYQVQEETSEMQQNIRAAMYYMEREIRMAGSDPFNTGNFSITAATPTSITFTLDINDGTNGRPDGTLNGNETITYAFADSDGDGFNDRLDRNGQPVAQNIDAVDFVYLDGNSPPNVIPFAGGAVSGPNLGQIRSVEITIVARTNDRLLFGTTNNRAYQNQRGTQILSAQADNVSRRTLTTQILCRNL
jgi:type IV pilus assembly protein PilW